MNMKSHLLIGIGGLMTTTAFVLACEGEPPKAPLLATSAPPPAELASAADEPTPFETKYPGLVEKVQERIQEQHCGCPDTGAATTAAIGDAGAPMIAVAGDGGATAATSATRGDIVGTIKTTPGYLSSVSVVYLEDAPKEPTRGMTGRVDNHQMTFSPMVQVITAGGSVTFVNTDPFPHNIFSPDGKFNMGTIPQNAGASPKRFDNVGAYTLLCNLHPGMIGYLVVSPSSYFAKTDAKGHYKIKDVPAGTWKITAWAPRLPTVTESVTLNGPLATTDFELHR